MIQEPDRERDRSGPPDKFREDPGIANTFRISVSSLIYHSFLGKYSLTKAIPGCIMFVKQITKEFS